MPLEIEISVGVRKQPDSRLARLFLPLKPTFEPGRTLPPNRFDQSKRHLTSADASADLTGNESELERRHRPHAAALAIGAGQARHGAHVLDVSVIWFEFLQPADEREIIEFASRRIAESRDIRDIDYNKMVAVGVDDGKCSGHSRVDSCDAHPLLGRLVAVGE